MPKTLAVPAHENVAGSRISPRTSTSQSAGAIVDWVLLPLLLLSTPLLYLSNARHNLPVASNVDERFGLGVLTYFHWGTANPHVFFYPTFFYYLTFAFTSLFPFAHTLFCARLLNLTFLGLTAFLSYVFCRDMLVSRKTGLVAAALIITSPLMIQSGSYICTDVLLAAGMVASLLTLSYYFRDPTEKRWLAAMVVLGFTVACKYTGALLFIVYLLLEFVGILRAGTINHSESVGYRFEKRTLSIAILSFGLFVLLLAVAFPTRVGLRAAFALQSDFPPVIWPIFRNKHKSVADYLHILRQLRHLLLGAGFALVVLAVLVQRFRTLYALLSPRRLYLGLVIIVLTVVVTTPYSFLTPAKFFSDMHDVFMGNAIARGEPIQWRIYLEWLRHNESITFVALGALGIVWAAMRDWWGLRVALLFALLYATTLATSHRGYARYLTMLLPVIYIFAADLMIRVWSLASGKRALALRLLLVLVVAGATVQLWVKQEALHGLQRTKDAFWRSYNVALSRNPSSVLFAGYAPSVELAIKGIPVRQIFWEDLSSRRMGNQLACGELLIYDLRSPNNKAASLAADPSLQTLFEDDEGYGQKVQTRADCAGTQK